jgi:hypothetical protein
MPLLILPIIEKNASATINLDKASLFSLSAVVADAWFSNPTNVKRCIVKYDSVVGNQSKTLIFDLSQTSPSDSIYFSPRARDNFQLDRLILEDFQGDVLVLSRSDLPTSFDISFDGSGGEPPTVVYFAFDGTNDSDLGGFGSVYDAAVGGQFYS